MNKLTEVVLEQNQPHVVEDANEPVMQPNFRYDVRWWHRLQRWASNDLYQLSLWVGGVRGSWTVTITYSDEEPDTVRTKAVRNKNV